MTFTPHQRKQIEVIDQIADQVAHNAVNFSTVSPVDDWKIDPRVCLTSVHFPHENLINQIEHMLIEPLQKIEPNFFYYPQNSIHMTIKNIRIINDPPNFNQADVQKVKQIFSNIIPLHKKFNVYFYRLVLFSNNLSLIGTTDEELDRIIFDLDKQLNTEGIPDDKIYTNTKYFFCNMTLARFNKSPSEAFKKKVKMLSKTLKFDPYQVDSVTLLTGNAVLNNRKLIGTWYVI